MEKWQGIRRILTAAFLAAGGALLILTLLSRSALASPGDLFVTPGGSGDCSQPATPCDLQTALTQAQDGDAIYIAQGEYTGSGGAVITVTKSITLYGGWDGTTTTPPVRDPETNPTTLNGESQRRVVYLESNISPTLEGLRLTNGLASGVGGGIYGNNSHPIIKNCQVYSNGAADGGGISLTYSDNAVLTDNKIYRNRVTTYKHGGGILISNSDNVLLEGNWIYSNTARYGGGGLYFDNNDNLTLTGNRVFSNTTNDDPGGGVHLGYSSNATIVDNHVFDNSAIGTDADGGGLFVRNSDITMINNIVNNNTSLQYGGGLFLIQTNAILERNAVQGNSAGSEGGIMIAQSTATLINNIVADNIKLGFPCAAGIGITNSAVTLIHNTIARNRGIGLVGSGVYVEGSGPQASIVTLTNNILISHTVGITVTGGNTATLNATFWGEGIWANETPWGGGGHIDAITNLIGDPDLANPADGDYHIGPGSDAIDVGIDTDVEIDIDSDRRLGSPDVGADEYVLYAYLPTVLRNH